MTPDPLTGSLDEIVAREIEALTARLVGAPLDRTVRDALPGMIDDLCEKIAQHVPWRLPEFFWQIDIADYHGTFAIEIYPAIFKHRKISVDCEHDGYHAYSGEAPGDCQAFSSSYHGAMILLALELHRRASWSR